MRIRIAGVVLVAAAGSALWRAAAIAEECRVREALFDELRPIALANCTLTRYGAPGGAYLLCAELLSGVEAAYSYGIAGEDSWGCEIATLRHVTVHQYDCFDDRRPACESATMIFHDECVEGVAMTVDGRAYDTVSSQIARNGDTGRRLVVKMDIEDAEWSALRSTPDEVLERIDQLVVEFHSTSRRNAPDVLRRLKRVFDVVHVHFNNYACSDRERPFPSSVFQVSFVNKRIGVRAAIATRPPLPNPLDRPDDPTSPDCQAAAW